MRTHLMTWTSTILTALGSVALTANGDAVDATEPPVVEATNFGWRAGDCVITTALPEGYPAPTAPGAFEVKEYPVVRRAQVSGEMSVDLGKNGGFWVLFRHIKSNKIAMTSPVEMDYHGWSEDKNNPDSWTMAFLYRSSDLGPTGQDGRVEIVDSEPMTVISLGLRGAYNMSNYRQALTKLNEWLAENPQWQPAGPPRSLAYNGPDVRSFKRWSELQIPLKPASPTEESEALADGAAEEIDDAAGSA